MQVNEMNLMIFFYTQESECKLITRTRIEFVHTEWIYMLT